jgi:hypothetical protein
MLTISRPVFTAAPLGDLDAPRQPWLCLPSTAGTAASAKELNIRARLVVRAGRVWSGVTAAPRDMG